MKQESWFKPIKKEHGGTLAVGRRRGRRPLTTKLSLHLTLKTQFGKGHRDLRRWDGMITRKLAKAAHRFGVKIYRTAVCANHLHLLILGQSRVGLQNFERMFAGHVAQTILKHYPLSNEEIESRNDTGCMKNRRKFWQYLTYTRIVTWGREFKAVARYIYQNVLESLNLAAYKPRGPKSRKRSATKSKSHLDNA